MTGLVKYEKPFIDDLRTETKDGIVAFNGRQKHTD